MKKLKKIITIGLVVMLAFTVCGCGEEAKETPTSEPQDWTEFY